MTIARATGEEAYQSERTAAFAREAGNRSTVFKEGELVVVNGYGSVYRFDEHTTGQFRGEIDKRLAGIDVRNLLNVTDATAAMIRDRQDSERPARNRKQDHRMRGAGARAGRDRQTWKHNGEVASRIDALADRLKPENERQTESSTIHGASAVAARLDQAGIAIVRVTADDVKALDALRSDEKWQRDDDQGRAGPQAAAFRQSQSRRHRRRHPRTATCSGSTGTGSTWRDSSPPSRAPFRHRNGRARACLVSRKPAPGSRATSKRKPRCGINAAPPAPSAGHRGNNHSADSRRCAAQPAPPSKPARPSTDPRREPAKVPAFSGAASWARLPVW